jgi:hypothetical protein
MDGPLTTPGSSPPSSADDYPPNVAESRRALALRLAVEVRRNPSGDTNSGYVTRTARAFEVYLRDGAVER